MKSKKLIKALRHRTFLVLSVMAVGAFVFAAVAPRVTADRFDEQIKQLQQQNAEKQSAVSQLQIQAQSYQDTINQLQAQIDLLQTQINNNLSRQVDLQHKIEENQRELDRQRKILGENIKVMYIEGDISMPEMLASSKNLSDFVDKEEYRTAIENKVQETMRKIAELQNRQKQQKVEIEKLLAQQKAQQYQVAINRSEQSRLLSMNAQQQDEYNSQIKANSEKMAQLEKERIAEYCRKSGCGGGIVGGGGYPWGGAVCIHTGQVTGPCYNYDWGVNGSVWNPATGGYGYRNCTDWVAWKTGAPAGLGHAATWDDRAASYGYSWDYSPRAGDAAVDDHKGGYGHVMYVEGVNGDGSLELSDYNGAGDGLYRRYTLQQSSYDGVFKFVHFR